ncbi:MAG TPA: response regulator [Niabella sp.]|nr:response regulator [Niabella sp.]
MEEKKGNILIVDDNEDILEYINRILQDDYTTIKTTHVSEALKKLDIHVIHLIISDVMMPGISGFEFCKQLKLNINLCHIPVILLTAKNTLQDKIDGLEHGADAYIEKPFSPKYLKVQIANLLTSRQLLKKHIANSPIVELHSIARSSSDFELIEKFNEIVFNNIDNPDLDIDLIATSLNMSRATFYRKTKGLFDMAPQELITLTRLKKAAEILKSGTCRINEVYNHVGFNSHTYFSTLFHKQFNMTPTEFMHADTK